VRRTAAAVNALVPKRFHRRQIAGFDDSIFQPPHETDLVISTDFLGHLIVLRVETERLLSGVAQFEKK